MFVYPFGAAGAFDAVAFGQEQFAVFDDGEADAGDVKSAEDGIDVVVEVWGELGFCRGRQGQQGRQGYEDDSCVCEARETVFAHAVSLVVPANPLEVLL